MSGHCFNGKKGDRFPAVRDSFGKIKNPVEKQRISRQKKNCKKVGKKPHKYTKHRAANTRSTGPRIREAQGREYAKHRAANTRSTGPRIREAQGREYAKHRASNTRSTGPRIREAQGHECRSRSHFMNCKYAGFADVRV